MKNAINTSCRLTRGVKSFSDYQIISENHWEFTWRFNEGDDAFSGHFPNQPILPGVFLVEMAQRACELALCKTLITNYRVWNVQRFRFHHAILPGDQCLLRVEWSAPNDPQAQLECNVSFYRDLQKIATGILTAKTDEALALNSGYKMNIEDYPRPAPCGMMEILQTMPHGHPMLLIDSAEMDAEQNSVSAYKNITFNEPCYKSVTKAFDREALSYPLSLMIESFAQSAGLLLARNKFLDQTDSSAVVVFAEFRNLQILGSAFPGAQLQHDVKLLQAGKTMVTLTGETRVGNTIIAKYEQIKAVCVPTVSIAKAAHA